MAHALLFPPIVWRRALNDVWEEIMKRRKNVTRRSERKDLDREMRRPEKGEERPERGDRDAGAGQPVQLDVDNR